MNLAGSPDVARLTQQSPLYQQVKDRLLERIQSGTWRPGQLIPNEFVLADELGVSQGTVRKALSELTLQKLLVRKQGRGTFVAEHTPETMLFRFFNLYDQDGQQISPQTLWVKARIGVAKPAECERLRLDKGADVIRIARVRTHEGRPFAHEQIVLPAHMFPGLTEAQSIPNTLYDHFQRTYGVTVIGGEERLEPMIAKQREAGWLKVDEGTPLLRLDRLTFSFNEQPIEWRISHCVLLGAHYLVRLG